ncbi:TPA: hypothetical protein ACH3X1_015460 [Trebouxia sp. C0004]
MSPASYKLTTAAYPCGCRMRLHTGIASAHTRTSSPLGFQAPSVDVSRLGSHSQASSSAKASGTGQTKRIQTKCALQPVPFKPSKLTVQRFPGTRQSGLCPQHPRRYTLTHNDLTGQLLLTIGHYYNKKQLSGWYNRLLRDEILAYWQFGSDKPLLHIECHVSGEETWLAPPILRDYIFRREMPLVLNVINFAEAPLLADNPAMADAQVMVHLASHVQAYHATVLWGRLSDCSSWQPPPRWARARLVAPNGPAVLPNFAGTLASQQILTDSLSDSAQQSMAVTAMDDPMQDEPCVLPTAELEASMHASPADRLDGICCQQTAAHSSTSLGSESQDVASSSQSSCESSMPHSRRPRQSAACYRLHVACTAATSPCHVHSQVNTGFQHRQLSRQSKLSGFAYHVPPRL